MTCAPPCQGPQCLQPTGMARPSSGPSADMDNVCTKQQPHQPQLPLLHDCSLQRPPHYSSLPVQLYVIKAAFLGYCWYNFIRVPDPLSLSFPNMSVISSLPQFNPRVMSITTLEFKTKFERNPQKVVMKYTMIIIKNSVQYSGFMRK